MHRDVLAWREITRVCHVGFYAGEQGDYIYTLGGNEYDVVRVEPLRENGNRFGLSGYYWPKSIPLPTVGALKPQLAAGGRPAGKAT